MADSSEVYCLICLLENKVLDEASFMMIYQDQLSHPMHSSWVFEEDGKILGFLHMRAEAQLHHAAKVAEILELVVREEKRSRGIGKKLLETAKEEAVREGCVRIELASSTWRTDAHRFYEQNGFRKSHYSLTCDLDIE